MYRIIYLASKSSLVAEAEVNKVQDSTQNNVLANKFGLGFRQANSFSLGAGNGQSAVLPQLLEDDREDVTVLDSNFCKFPLVRERGVCKCPNNFRFIFGRCVIDNDISDNGKDLNIKLKK